jgi:hypothetical protein
MNAKASALLTDPHPCGHIVYPYAEEGLVGQAVCLYASAGLRNGEGVVLILTAAHYDSILLRLTTEGFNVQELQKSRRLNCVRAEDLLADFMVDGVPDKKLFHAAVGKLIARARSATGKGWLGLVRVFGEMVSLLWNRDLGATVSLEEMWNEVIEKHRVPLLCTYELNGHENIPAGLRRLHTHSCD